MIEGDLEHGDRDNITSPWRGSMPVTSHIDQFVFAGEGRICCVPGWPAREWKHRQPNVVAGKNCSATAACERIAVCIQYALRVNAAADYLLVKSPAAST